MKINYTLGIIILLGLTSSIQGMGFLRAAMIKSFQSGKGAYANAFLTAPGLRNRRLVFSSFTTVTNNKDLHVTKARFALSGQCESVKKASTLKEQKEVGEKSSLNKHEIEALLLKYKNQVGAHVAHASVMRRSMPNAGALEFEWLPGCFIKVNHGNSVKYDRIQGAKLLQDCIDATGLKIMLPEQWIAHSNREYVVAKKIEGKHPDILTNDQFEDLIAVCMNTDFCEPKKENLILDKEGKLYIIDTEIQATDTHWIDVFLESNMLNESQKSKLKKFSKI